LDLDSDSVSPNCIQTLFALATKQLNKPQNRTAIKLATKSNQRTPRRQRQQQQHQHQQIGQRVITSGKLHGANKRNNQLNRAAAKIEIEN